MTRALVTQLVDALESGIAYVENEANQLTTREYKTAITAARGYLATEPSGERAELIADLRELIDLHAFAKDVVDRAAHLLEADAQQSKPDIKDLQANGKGPAPCARFCEANSFEIEIRRLTSKLNAQQANKPTGWDNGLSQDYCAEFGKWLASRPGARQQIKEMFDTSTPLQP